VAQDGGPERTAERDSSESLKEPSERDKLLPAVRDVTWRFARVHEKHKIVTIPFEVTPELCKETLLQRVADTASMDTLSVRKSRQGGFFHVTLTEKAWKPENRRRSTWRGSSAGRYEHGGTRGDQDTTYRSCGLRRAPSKVRKLLGCSSNAEVGRQLHGAR